MPKAIEANTEIDNKIDSMLGTELLSKITASDSQVYISRVLEVLSNLEMFTWAVHRLSFHRISPSI